MEMPEIPGPDELSAYPSTVIMFDEPLFSIIGPIEDIEAFFRRHFDVIGFGLVDWRKNPIGGWNVTVNWSYDAEVPVEPLDVKIYLDGKALSINPGFGGHPLFTFSLVKHLVADFPGCNTKVTFLGEDTAISRYPTGISDEELLLRIIFEIEDTLDENGEYDERSNFPRFPTGNS